MKFKKGIAIIGIAVILIGTTFVFGAAGDSKDPLVSLSYLNERLDKVSGDVKSDKLEVVELNKGDILIGQEGTEIILRGGSATAYGVKEHAGLADLTAGSDIDTATSIKHNHQLIVPRSDGRGIKATSNLTTYVMVRGEFTISR